MRSALALAALLLIAAAPAPAPQNVKPSVKPSVKLRLKPSVSVADQARQRAMDRDEARAGARTAADTALRLRQQLIALGAAETAGEKTVGAAGARLAALNAAEADLSQRMGRNQVALARLLGALELYRRDPPPALLISPRNAVDAVNAAILMRAITPELERRAKAFAAEARQLQTLRRHVVLANGALFTAESDGADRRAEIERTIAQKTALAHDLDARADAADAEVRRLAARAQALGQTVVGLQAKADADNGGGGGGSGGGGDGALLHLTAPISGAPVRRFNDPWHGQARSEGWSWAMTPGAVVLSPADGRIDYAGPLKGWGLVLILRLAGGYHLVLAGLGASGARIGAEVSAGQPIGHMAAALPVSKNKAVVPELYLEVRKGDAPVDPARWLGGPAGGREPRPGGH